MKNIDIFIILCKIPQMFKFSKSFEKKFYNFFPASYAVKNLPYILVFKATHWCWYNCPHCCESSGINRDKTFIPKSVIKHYIDSAVKNDKFYNNVVITGGELMSAYEHLDANYVPNLINYITNKNISLDIKTNGAWVKKLNLRETIFQDLINCANCHEPFAYQISLSLDKYHPHALENNYEIIRELAHNKDLKQPVLIHISGFDDDKKMFDNLITKLINTNNMTLEEAINFNTRDFIRILNKKIYIISSFSPAPFANGRATNLSEAIETKFPQFKFLGATHGALSLLMAFDAAGNVTLGENSGKKITVPWRDKNNNPRPLNKIRKDLVSKTILEEIRVKIKTFFFPKYIEK